MRLTDMAIQTAKPPATGRVMIWDDSSPLGLRITAKGAKSFVVILNERRHTIGRYGAITLQQARTAAKQLKAEQTLGRLVPSSRSLADARSEYLKGITIRANTRRYYERNLRRLPDCRLTDVSAADLNRILDALSPPARGQALKTYVAFFNWCIRRHYLDTSPCIRFRGEKTTSRSRVLTDEELCRIWTCTKEPKEDGKLPASYCAIVKLLLLTGQRKSEIANLQTSWIRDNKITFPKEICKNNRVHTIPLGELTVSVLKSVTETASTPFLFPALGGASKSSSSWSNAKIALDATSGVTG
jgi:integrase